MATYKVIEAFQSIQGEGRHMGVPATFIRLFDCNLNCTFCDTVWNDKSKIVEMTTEEIITLCDGLDLVVITGGEPSMQNLNPLIRELQKQPHTVAVETNGYKYKNIRAANHIALSPKNYSRPEGHWDEIKLLFSISNRVKQEEELLYWVDERYSVCVGAINNNDTIDKANMLTAINVAIVNDVPLNPQLHKLLGVE